MTNDNLGEAAHQDSLPLEPWGDSEGARKETAAVREEEDGTMALTQKEQDDLKQQYLALADAIGFKPESKEKEIEKALNRFIGNCVKIALEQAEVKINSIRASFFAARGELDKLKGELSATKTDIKALEPSFNAVSTMRWQFEKLSNEELQKFEDLLKEREAKAAAIKSPFSAAISEFVVQMKELGVPAESLERPLAALITELGYQRWQEYDTGKDIERSRKRRIL